MDSERLVRTVLGFLEDPAIRSIQIECPRGIGFGLRGLLNAISANAQPSGKPVTVAGLG